LSSTCQGQLFGLAVIPPTIFMPVVIGAMAGTPHLAGNSDVIPNVAEFTNSNSDKTGINLKSIFYFLFLTLKNFILNFFFIKKKLLRKCS
jgi:hypothetical protein